LDNLPIHLLASKKTLKIKFYSPVGKIKLEEIQNLYTGLRASMQASKHQNHKYRLLDAICLEQLVSQSLMFYLYPCSLPEGAVTLLLHCGTLFGKDLYCSA